MPCNNDVGDDAWAERLAAMASRGRSGFVIEEEVLLQPQLANMNIVDRMIRKTSFSSSALGNEVTTL